MASRACSVCGGPLLARPAAGVRMDPSPEWMYSCPRCQARSVEEHAARKSRRAVSQFRRALLEPVAAWALAARGSEVWLALRAGTSPAPLTFWDVVGTLLVGACLLGRVAFVRDRYGEIAWATESWRTGMTRRKRVSMRLRFHVRWALPALLLPPSLIILGLGARGAMSWSLLVAASLASVVVGLLLWFRDVVTRGAAVRAGR